MVLITQIFHFVLLRGRDPLAYQVLCDGRMQHALRTFRQLFEVFGPQVGKGVTSFIDQQGPRICPGSQIYGVRHRLHGLSLYFISARNTLVATSELETLYVPAAMDCCRAATFSVRTSLPERA